MPMSRSVRKIRTAISPRFATRTFENITRILSMNELRRPADRRPRDLGAGRHRALRRPLLESRLLGDGRLLRRDGDGLVRRAGRPADWTQLADRLPARSDRGQAP